MQTRYTGHRRWRSQSRAATYKKSTDNVMEEHDHVNMLAKAADILAYRKSSATFAIRSTDDDDADDDDEDGDDDVDDVGDDDHIYIRKLFTLSPPIDLQRCTVRHQSCQPGSSWKAALTSRQDTTHNVRPRSGRGCSFQADTIGTAHQRNTYLVHTCLGETHQIDWLDL